jgi:hypothetical protein
MIDITGPKVLVPTLLFAVLSPGFLLSLPPGAGKFTVTLVHAAVLSLLYFIIAKYVLKVNLTAADLIVPAVLFVLLSPGVLVTLMPSAGTFMPVALHAVIFAVVFAFLRGQFPEYY